MLRPSGSYKQGAKGELGCKTKLMVFQSCGFNRSTEITYFFLSERSQKVALICRPAKLGGQSGEALGLRKSSYTQRKKFTSFCLRWRR